MARINIADKETLDITKLGVDAAREGLSTLLERIGQTDDATVDTLFGLIRLLSTSISTSPIKAIHRGYTTASDSGTTITHPSVDVNKSIVLFNVSPSATNLAHGAAMIARSATSITFTTRSVCAITWQVIEFN